MSLHRAFKVPLKPTAKDMIAACQNYMDRELQRSKCHIRREPDRSIIYASDGSERIYVPTATGQLFDDSPTFINLLCGPFGSGKSTTCANFIVNSVCRMPRWHNGRRRARWAIVRNTSGELQSTTLQTWLAWFGDLGDIRKRQKPILTYEHTFNDGHGVIELELIFIALDRPDDVRKVKSLELTGVYLNELSELPQIVMSYFKGRVNGRYPSKAFCPEPYWSGIIADTNPPDTDHWIYNDFEVQRLPSYRILHQPPGLLVNADGSYSQNPDCDNAEHLSYDYYTKLAEGQKQGFINVFCLGQYGLVESGKRVYPEYNDDLHGVDHLAAIQGQPIHLGWDFGLTPACIVFQMSARGAIHVLKEYVSENMGIRTFAKNIVIPALEIDFPYNKVGKSTGDPAGAAGDTIMEELSCIGELSSLGIKTIAASSNSPDVRIASVCYFLNNMIDGKPGFLLDRGKCPVLRKGFMSGYHFKRVNVANDDRYQDVPNKNKYSHPHDGLQYGVMPFAAERIIDKQVKKPVIDMYNPVMRWG